MAWLLYSPPEYLIILGGISLGLVTNNIIECHVVVGLLIDTLSNDVSHFVIYLDLELVVSELNRIYTIQNPLLFHLF